jgi:hypothetical protein
VCDANNYTSTFSFNQITDVYTSYNALGTINYIFEALVGGDNLGVDLPPSKNVYTSTIASFGLYSVTHFNATPFPPSLPTQVSINSNLMVYYSPTYSMPYIDPINGQIQTGDGFLLLSIKGSYYGAATTNTVEIVSSGMAIPQYAYVPTGYVGSEPIIAGPTGMYVIIAWSFNAPLTLPVGAYMTAIFAFDVTVSFVYSVIQVSGGAGWLSSFF